MENQQHPQEDEIDLRDYINVVVKRKKLIISIFLVAVITSAIVSLLMPKVYEITSTVQLGNVNGLLISKEKAREIILNQNSLQSIIKELNLKIDLENLKKDIKINDVSGTNLLKIKMECVDIDTAIKINDAILNPLITQGQGIYQERLSLVNERLKELDSAIKNSEGDINRTQNLLSGLPNSNNISQSDISLRIILLQNTLPNYSSNLNSLMNQRIELKLSLSTVEDFKVFDSAIKPKKAIGPKKKRIVITAGMISLILGLFLAFCMEFWQKGKKEKTNNERMERSNSSKE